MGVSEMLREKERKLSSSVDPSWMKKVDGGLKVEMKFSQSLDPLALLPEEKRRIRPDLTPSFGHIMDFFISKRR